MIDVSYILKLKYPSCDFKTDVILQDDGGGVYIKEWNLEAPKPTKKDLNDWAIELELQYRQELARQARVYPPIEVQLDMQYHDAVEGTTTWIDAVEAVKLANPIPEE